MIQEKNRIIFSAYSDAVYLVNIDGSFDNYTFQNNELQENEGVLCIRNFNEANLYLVQRNFQKITNSAI